MTYTQKGEAGVKALVDKLVDAGVLSK